MSKIVVVRSHLGGVHCGTIVKREGDTVILRNSRRAWSWKGALSCSELAHRGPGPGSKVCVAVKRVILFTCVEIIDTTQQAATAWANAPEAST